MKKSVVFVILCVVVLIIISIVIYLQNEILMDSAIPFLWFTNISCYWRKSNGILELGTGEWDEAMMVPDRCIFFMESTCFGEEGTESAILTPRQACAVESAAKMNPGLNIFLLYLSPEQFSKNSKKLVSLLETYSNIYIRRVHLPAYIKNTPMQKWYKRNLEKLLDEETDPKAISDIVKFLTLWKNGGTFLDLDVIIQKRLDVFSNFAGAENEETIGRGIFSIDISTALGRKVAEACLEEVKRGFREYYWDHTNVISEVLKNLCQQEHAKDMTEDVCKGFTVYPPNQFFPIPSEDWRHYFEENNSDEIITKIENATMIKIWAENSDGKKVSIKSTAPYNIVSSKYCPIVHKNCDSAVLGAFVYGYEAGQGAKQINYCSLEASTWKLESNFAIVQRVMVAIICIKSLRLSAIALILIRIHISHFFIFAVVHISRIVYNKRIEEKTRKLYAVLPQYRQQCWINKVKSLLLKYTFLCFILSQYFSI